jgi:hypothetical protein
VKLRWGYSIVDLSDSLALWLINGEEDGDLSVDMPFCGLMGLSSIGQSRLPTCLNVIPEDVVLIEPACLAISLSNCVCERLGLNIEDVCPAACSRETSGFQVHERVALGFRFQGLGIGSEVSKLSVHNCCCMRVEGWG